MRQVLFNHPIFQQYSFKNSQFRYRLPVKSRHSAQNGAVGSGDIQIAKGIFCVDVLYPVSECLILVFGRMVRLLISYSISFVRVFIFTGRSAVPTSNLLKAYFVLMFLSFVRGFIFTGRNCFLFVCLFFIFCPNVRFRWARGASARGKPKEDRGKARELAFPLSPLGFPLALPFPDSLTPLGRKPCISA